MDDGTKIFIEKKKDFYKISLRTSFESINLIKIVNAAKARLRNFTGGGHPHACGCIYKGAEKEALDALIEEYRSVLKTKIS